MMGSKNRSYLELFISIDVDQLLFSPVTLDFIYPSLVHGKEEQNRNQFIVYANQFPIAI